MTPSRSDCLQRADVAEEFEGIGHQGVHELTAWVDGALVVAGLLTVLIVIGVAQWVWG